MLSTLLESFRGLSRAQKCSPLHTDYLHNNLPHENYSRPLSNEENAEAEDIGTEKENALGD